MAELDWDEENIEHLAQHSITAQEVGEFFDGPILPRRGGTDGPDRARLLGRTASGRYLALVVQRKRGGVVRPFTGRDMRSHERGLYDRQAGR